MLQGLLEAVAIPVVLFSLEGEILLANAPARSLFVESGDRDGTAGQVARANGQRLALALPQGPEGRTEPNVFELRLLEPHTLAERLFEATRSTIDDPEHGQSVVIALRDRRERLDQARFLSNISHEFLTPLNTILGYTSILLQGVSGPLDESVRNQLYRIEANGVRLQTMIGQILDTTRLEMGRMPVLMSRFSVPGVVNEVTSELEPLIARSTLPVTTEIPEAMPTVWSDRDKVKHILRQFLTNALKFTHEGGVSIRIRFRSREQQVGVSVIDSGIGIPAIDCERVFEDFQQLDNSRNRRYGGTGLGLSICRRFADLLGAQVMVQSVVGKGSTFTLLLPVRGH